MTDYRSDLLSVLDLFIKHEGQFPYEEVRPMPSRVWYGNLPGITAHLEAGGTVDDDCSGSATLGFNLAKWGDPNGENFNGFGNTETVLAHLPNFTNTAKVNPCTIGIYGGEASRQHEIIFLEKWNGDATRVFSHGMGYRCQSTIGVENAAHAGQPLIFCEVAGLIPVPPDPYHYEYYDTTVVALPHGRNSERNVVENYDKARKILSPANAVQVGMIEDNLKALLTRVQNNKKGKSKAYIAAHHMDFREIWIGKRAKGLVVVK